MKHDPVNMKGVEGAEDDDKGHTINANRPPSGARRHKIVLYSICILAYKCYFLSSLN